MVEVLILLTGLSCVCNPTHPNTTCRVVKAEMHKSGVHLPQQPDIAVELKGTGKPAFTLVCQHSSPYASEK